MVIWPAFRMGQYRVNDHPYYAPQFITMSAFFEIFLGKFIVQSIFDTVIFRIPITVTVISARVQNMFSVLNMNPRLHTVLLEFTFKIDFPMLDPEIKNIMK